MPPFDIGTLLPIGAKVEETELPIGAVRFMLTSGPPPELPPAGGIVKLLFGEPWVLGILPIEPPDEGVPCGDEAKPPRLLPAGVVVEGERFWVIAPLFDAGGNDPGP